MNISRIKSYFLSAAGAAAALYILHTPFYHWLWDPRKEGPVSALLPYYPVLFAIFFTEQNRIKNKAHEIFFISGGFFLILAGHYIKINALIWPGVYWSVLSLFSRPSRRIHLFGYLLVFLTPPFSGGLEILAGFSLRIFLSRISAFFLKAFDGSAFSSGNTVFFQDLPFTVDPACEGLKMLSALILLLMYLIFSAKTTDAECMNIKMQMKIIILIAVSAALWIFTNLIRIIILIAGGIEQNSVLHDTAGIFIFMTSTLMPVLLLKKILFGKIHISETISGSEAKSSVMETPQRSSSQELHFFQFSAASLLMTAAVLTAYYPGVHPENGSVSPGHDTVQLIQNREEHKADESGPQTIPGFLVYRPSGKNKGEYRDIAAYKKDNSGLILKNQFNPLKIGHHPRLCWKGEGYNFLNESEISRKGEPHSDLRLALLERKGRKHREYFALIWWYENAIPLTGSASSEGIHHYTMTASEFSWRYVSFLNKTKFRQINILIPLDDRSQFQFLKKILEKNKIEEYAGKPAVLLLDMQKWKK